MDTQKPVFEQLVFGPFAANLADVLYPRRKSGDIVYSEAAYKVKEPVPQPQRSPSYYEHDAVFLLELFGTKKRKGGGETRDVLKKDVVSVEIKTTAGDIYESPADKYTGATSQFYIAAPRNLLHHVLCAYRSHEKRYQIGVVDSDTGRIVVLPLFQRYDRDRRDRILAHCHTSVHRIPEYNNPEPFLKRRVPAPDGGKEKFVYFNGMRVNEEYVGLFREMESNGYAVNR